jgi:tetratricopeptide (TPR) repeat protein
MTSAQCQQTAENWFDKGTALSNHGKYDEAIKAYDEAIKLDPNYAAAWNDRGIALDESGKYEEAIQAYNKALEIYKLVLNSGSIGYPSSMIL